jgi:DNA (cytosine-5)-methyltransferase 1
MPKTPPRKRTKKRATDMPEKIRVVELFAGVGGFRLGLEGVSEAIRKKSPFKTVWANQWEPATRVQHAFNVYRARFEKESVWPAERWEHANDDINKAINEHVDHIPDHDLLCGGFPCQDYSVARTLNQAAGIAGKKGVLWWAIHDILAHKQGFGEVRANRKDHAVPFLLLENVDRLLSSPAAQRGRDFAVMLASLANLGYAVEWRVINAADYGMAQRRRRIFIVGYHKSTETYSRLKNSADRINWLDSVGLLAQAFPVQRIESERDWISEKDADIELENGKDVATRENLLRISKHFNTHNPSKSQFQNAGLMIGWKVWTRKLVPAYTGKHVYLKDVLVAPEDVPDDYFIPRAQLKRWRYLKGPKHEKRVDKITGYEYSYDEGGMAFPDESRKNPRLVEHPDGRMGPPKARTIITGEGGKSPSRFKHVVQEADGRFRRLTPIELERLNGFPDGHTQPEGCENIGDIKRAFFMGNALVVGVVERIGKVLAREIEKHKGSNAKTDKRQKRSTKRKNR